MDEEQHRIQLESKRKSAQNLQLMIKQMSYQLEKDLVNLKSVTVSLEKALMPAEPAMDAIQEAKSKINVNDIKEIKTMQKPPVSIELVMKAVITLI